MSTATSQTTRLLLDLADGDETAVDRLLPLVYDELRRRARQVMRDERKGHTLTPTALVHEAYVRLVDKSIDWRGRSHFIAVAAQCMRRILVDYAKARAAEKRGGGRAPVTLVEHITPGRPAQLIDVLALDELLRQLEHDHERVVRVVELRYFGVADLTNEGIGYVLGVSQGTVKNDWRFGQAWLKSQLLAEPSVETDQ